MFKKYLFIVFFFLSLWCFFMCSSCDKKPGKKAYVDHPLGYYPPSPRYELNNKERQVFEWLVRWPPDNKARHWKGEPIPYNTYEDWVEAGKKINEVEETLLEFHENNTVPDWGSVIEEVLAFVGSSESVPLLIKVMTDENLKLSRRTDALRSLAVIGDPRAHQAVYELIINIKIDSSSLLAEIEMKVNGMLLLGEAGDERVIPIIEEELKNKYFNYVNYGDSNSYLSKILEDLRGKN